MENVKIMKMRVNNKMIIELFWKTLKYFLIALYIFAILGAIVFQSLKVAYLVLRQAFLFVVNRLRKLFQKAWESISNKQRK